VSWLKRPRRRACNALNSVNRMIESGMTFQALGPHDPRCGCQTCLCRLSAFVSARIGEHPDPDEAEALLELWNMAHDQIDVTPPPWGHRERLPSPQRLKLLLLSNPIVVRQYVPGEVKNEQALQKLAQRWRDHPEFQPEWETTP